MAAHLSHLFVSVRDLRATHRFYVELLGLEVLVGGPDRTYMRVGGGGGFHIGFEAIPAAALPTPGIEIVVRVDDVDAAYERLLADGVAFDGPPADQEWGARHVWASDPTGYRVSIYSTDGPGTP
ncbi:MAG TPA: VOC family protein [Candidatus Limnocylindrales bacterium]|nr:VOC family protein [Candidatus Limnocylindrales bacterium]